MVMNTRLQGTKFAVALGICLGVAGCGGSKDEPAPAPNPPSPTELARGDVRLLRETEHAGYSEFDRENGRVFTQIFGGTDAADVTNYLDTRLRFYFDQGNRTATITGMEDRPVTIAEIFPQSSDPRAQVGAVNAGTGLWLSSLVYRKSLSLSVGSESHPINASRIGITILGPGYQSNLETSRGSIPLHPTFRQAVLIHEARHSDCTGGISETWLESVRQLGRSQAASDKYFGLQCGHLHAKCPSGHDLEGLAACDREPWGAYTVGNIFYRAVAREFEIGSVDYQVASYYIADFESRVLVDRDGTTPDMSSSGHRP
jgi:hypothetical protein